MSHRHATSVVLGACAVATALLLARPGALGARAEVTSGAGAGLDDVRRRARIGIAALGSPAAGSGQPTLVLCADCTASRAVVRVLRRRSDQIATLPPVHVIVDRRWPDVEALVQRTPGSTLTEFPALSRHVPVTPVAIAASGSVSSAESYAMAADSLAIGVTQVVSLLARPRRSRAP